MAYRNTVTVVWPVDETQPVVGQTARVLAWTLIAERARLKASAIDMFDADAQHFWAQVASNARVIAEWAVEALAIEGTAMKQEVDEDELYYARRSNR